VTANINEKMTLAKGIVLIQILIYLTLNEKMVIHAHCCTTIIDESNIDPL